jgi:hypothetical protein
MELEGPGTWISPGTFDFKGWWSLEDAARGVIKRFQKVRKNFQRD